MSETTDDKDKKKPLTLSRPGRLELKKTVEKGQIRQSFSHGRSKPVTVEVRKKRTFPSAQGGELSQAPAPEKAGENAAEKAGVEAAASAASAPAPTPRPTVRPTARSGTRPTQAPAQPAAGDDHLTDAEKALRARVLEEARREEEQRRVEEAERARIEAEAAKERARIEAEEAARQAAEEAARPAEPAPVAEEPRPAPPTPAAPRVPSAEDGEAARKPRKGAKVEKPKKSLAPAKEDARRRGKLTISKALDSEGGERVRSLASVRRARERERRAQAAQRRSGEAAKVIREVVVPETITVQELSNRMAERGAEVVKALMKMGVMATINQPIDADTAELVVNEFGHVIKRVSEADVEEGLFGALDDTGDLVPRPPVVTVMGHVDHGKTSLLDALRKTDVAAKESGGITQHIGAYQVTMPSNEKITFLDTPGHEAFTQMRARGAKVTDIVVLVVAADDGIMPQTIEAIHHASAAEVPVIVAINKIDLPAADSELIKTDLLRHDVALEGYGGDVLWVEVSAKQGTNLDRLEEAILLQAELLELRANPARAAEGVIVEAKMEQGRGNVATVLVQRGTLKVGDVFVAGAEWGRVRALIDDHGRPIEEAGPSVPVEVLGLQGSPEAGDDFGVVDNEARARQIAEYRTRRAKTSAAATGGRGTVEQMLASIAAGEAEEFPVIVKADVQGSVEAIVSALEKMGTEEVRANVLHAAVGGINESDVTLARASKALIIGFNVRANPQARELARRDGVEIRYYSIIYDVTNDVRQALTGMLSPDTRETRLGEAEVKEVFNVTKVGRIAGCVVADGLVRRGARVRLLRDSVVVHEGELSSLRHFKDEVKEVRSGSECGIGFENYNDVQVGDVIECFEVEQVARTL